MIRSKQHFQMAGAGLQKIPVAFPPRDFPCALPRTCQSGLDYKELPGERKIFRDGWRGFSKKDELPLLFDYG